MKMWPGGRELLLPSPATMLLRCVTYPRFFLVSRADTSVRWKTYCLNTPESQSREIVDTMIVLPVIQLIPHVNKNKKANEMGLTEEELTSKVEETKKEIFKELYG